MNRRVPFAFKHQSAPIQPSFGEPVIQIKIEVDQYGLMKTSINKPLPAVQVLGLLLDSMQGQYGMMAQQASLLINPNGEPAKTPNNPAHEFIACTDNAFICQVCGSHKGNHGGKKEENDNCGGGDTGERITT